MYPNQGSTLAQATQRSTPAIEPGDVKRPKHAENAIIGLQHTIEQLEGSVANLIGKINPILIPSVPEKEPQAAGTMANMSNVASTIVSFTHALERIRENIEEAANRVDI